jgi:hypothetical protein
MIEPLFVRGHFDQPRRDLLSSQMDLNPIIVKSEMVDWIKAQRTIRSSLMVPGFFGGLLGVFIGMILALFSFLGGSYMLSYSEGFLSPSIGGTLCMLLGLLGSTGAIWVSKKRLPGGRIMIASGGGKEPAFLPRIYCPSWSYKQP